jgi:hypothetical protein
MIALVLIAGAILWIVSEILELAQGGFTPFNSGVSAVAFAAVAVGLWVFWAKATPNKVAQAAVILTSLGMGLFTIVAFQAIGSGATSDADIVGSPLYSAAGTAVGLGASLLSYWLIRVSSFPKMFGVVVTLATAFTLGVAFVPALTSFQPLSNIVLAGVFLMLGIRIRKQNT